MLSRHGLSNPVCGLEHACIHSRQTCFWMSDQRECVSMLKAVQQIKLHSVHHPMVVAGVMHQKTTKTSNEKLLPSWSHVCRSFF